MSNETNITFNRDSGKTQIKGKCGVQWDGTCKLEQNQDQINLNCDLKKTGRCDKGEKMMENPINRAELKLLQSIRTEIVEPLARGDKVTLTKSKISNLNDKLNELLSHGSLKKNPGGVIGKPQEKTFWVGANFFDVLIKDIQKAKRLSGGKLVKGKYWDISNSYIFFHEPRGVKKNPLKNPTGMIGRIPLSEIQMALDVDKAQLVKMRSDLKKLQSGKKVEDLTIKGAKETISGLETVIKNKKHIIAKRKNPHENPLLNPKIRCFVFDNPKKSPKEVKSNPIAPLCPVSVELIRKDNGKTVIQSDQALVDMLLDR